MMFEFTLSPLEMSDMSCENGSLSLFEFLFPARFMLVPALSFFSGFCMISDLLMSPGVPSIIPSLVTDLESCASSVLKSKLAFLLGSCSP